MRRATDLDRDVGHIPGAQNMRLEDIRAHLPELAPSKNRPVRLMCRTDRRSSEAAAILAAAGFADTRVIRGEMTVWRANGWTVQRSRGANVRTPGRAGNGLGAQTSGVRPWRTETHAPVRHRMLTVDWRDHESGRRTCSATKPVPP
jgi:rhodanese-related sulfurtransferase